MEETKTMAYLIKQEDGYHVEELDGSIGPVCDKLTSDGYIKLSSNASNRKCYNKKAADKYFDENPDGKIELAYKETRVVGARSTTLPNAKLIAYLSEEDQEEYKAIIARALEAKNSAKPKPMTEREKLEAKIAKAKEALAKLEAAAQE